MAGRGPEGLQATWRRPSAQEKVRRSVVNHSGETAGRVSGAPKPFHFLVGGNNFFYAKAFIKGHYALLVSRIVFPLQMLRGEEFPPLSQEHAPGHVVLPPPQGPLDPQAEGKRSPEGEGEAHKIVAFDEDGSPANDSVAGLAVRRGCDVQLPARDVEHNLLAIDSGAPHPRHHPSTVTRIQQADQVQQLLGGRQSGPVG